MDRFGLLLRGILSRNDVRRARRVHAKAVRRAERRARAQELLFENATRCSPDSDRILVARARSITGEPYWSGLDLKTLLSTHSWVTGASRSGKTAWIFMLLAQLMARGTPNLNFDMKGEYADWVLSVLIPALCARRECEAVLGKLIVVRPFGPGTCELRLTAAEPGVPRAVQAMNLASALEEALGDEHGTRMARALLRLCSLAIELNEPLTAVRGWLSNPASFARAAARSEDTDTREYARSALPKESKSAISAALARLDSFLFLDEVRRAVEAPRCVDLCRFEPGSCVIVDLGSPPAGADRAQRFWAGALTGRTVRGILSRKLGPDSMPALFVCEEIQDGLSARQAHQLGRATALMGFKQVYCLVSHQAASQLSAVDPNLVSALRTNVGIELGFRAARQDARILAEAMPTAEGAPRGAERVDLVRELQALPQRECVLWLRALGLAPQRVRTPKVDFDALRNEGKDFVGAVREWVERQSHWEPLTPDSVEPAAEAEDASLFEFLDADDDRHPRLG